MCINCVFYYHDVLRQILASGRYLLLTFNFAYYLAANSNNTTKNTPRQQDIKTNTKPFILFIADFGNFDSQTRSQSIFPPEKHQH